MILHAEKTKELTEFQINTKFTNAQIVLQNTLNLIRFFIN